MVNYTFNVVDEDGSIRGVALGDTEDTASLRLVPTGVAGSAPVQPAVELESPATNTTGSTLLSGDLYLSSDSSDSEQAPVLQRTRGRKPPRLWATHPGECVHKDREIKENHPGDDQLQHLEFVSSNKEMWRRVEELQNWTLAPSIDCQAQARIPTSH